MTSPASVPPQGRPEGAPRRPRFPPEVVARAVALRRMHSLTLRQTKAAMAARGIEVSYESLRAWGRKPPEPSPAPDQAPAAGAPWTAQERMVRLNGEPVHLWVARSLDGRVLEVLVQRRRAPSAAQRRLAGLLRSARAAEGPST